MTLLEDLAGTPRVAFVINPGDVDVVARATVRGVREAEDLLDGTRVAVTAGVLEVRMPPRTVRMLGIT